jgi:hypothetical protein
VLTVLLLSLGLTCFLVAYPFVRYLDGRDRD